MKNDDIINLNLGLGYDLNVLPFGETKNIAIRVGRELFYIDVTKNSDSAYVERYKYHKDRNSFSKYAAGLHGIFCKPDIWLTREMIEEIEEIEKAQNIARKYHGKVIFR